MEMTPSLFFDIVEQEAEILEKKNNKPIDFNIKGA